MVICLQKGANDLHMVQVVLEQRPLNGCSSSSSSSILQSNRQVRRLVSQAPPLVDSLAAREPLTRRLSPIGRRHWSTAAVGVSACCPAAPGKTEPAAADETIAHQC